MNDANTFVAWLREQMEQREWNQSRLAREIGVTRGGVSKIFSQSRLASVETLIGIARVFNVGIEEVLSRAGYELAANTNAASEAPALPELPAPTPQLLPLPSDPDSFAAWLSGEMQGRGWNAGWLARSTGVGTKYVERILKGTLPNPHYCQELAIAFSMPIEEVLKRAGHSTGPAGHTVTVDVIVAYLEQLSSSDQDSIVRFVGNLYSQREAQKHVPENA